MTFSLRSWIAALPSYVIVFCLNKFLAGAGWGLIPLADGIFAVILFNYLFWTIFIDDLYLFWFKKEGGGADLIALEKLNVPCIGFEPDSQRYFDIHHSKEDTFDKINKRELELSSAAIGALIYLLDKYF